MVHSLHQCSLFQDVLVKNALCSTNMTQKIAYKTGERYEKIMPIIGCIYILFPLLRSYSMCIRGGRSLQKPELTDDFVIACNHCK